MMNWIGNIEVILKLHQSPSNNIQQDYHYRISNILTRCLAKKRFNGKCMGPILLMA